MRPIDADELKNVFEEHEDRRGDLDCDWRILIDNAPTVEPFAEVQYETFREYERPHGEWMKSDIPESVLAKCSYCGFDCGAYTHNFCPNCGAEMRGKEE